ncbi:MAG: hypothetical protein K2J75_06755 [Clostridia bacterium]|nr:hypothetical protein [Clostridia bacterium]
MRYCKKCGSRLDDFDSYCGSCGTKVDERSYTSDYANVEQDDNRQDKRNTVEDSINNVTDIVSKNPESFICFLLGILSITFGTFICAIISLVFGKKAVEKGQDKDEKCAMFCKVGRICSKISIVLAVIAVVVSVLWWVILPLFIVF